jgi:hypothetical protein
MISSVYKFPLSKLMFTMIVYDASLARTSLLSQ